MIPSRAASPNGLHEAAWPWGSRGETGADGGLLSRRERHVLAGNEVKPSVTGVGPAGQHGVGTQALNLELHAREAAGASASATNGAKRVSAARKPRHHEHALGEILPFVDRAPRA